VSATTDPEEHQWGRDPEADLDVVRARLEEAEEEVKLLRRRLQESPARVQSLEERLLESKGQLSHAVSRTRS